VVRTSTHHSLNLAYRGSKHGRTVSHNSDVEQSRDLFCMAPSGFSMPRFIGHVTTTLPLFFNSLEGRRLWGLETSLSVS
jgi:hypothetical protein